MLESRNTLLNKSLIKNCVELDKGEKSIPSKRKETMVDMHSDVSATLVNDYNGNVIVDGWSFKLCGRDQRVMFQKDKLGVIIMPRKYIMEQVDERAFKTLVILIFAALCILVIGCVCILILTNGVSKEMNLRAELKINWKQEGRQRHQATIKVNFLQT